MENIKEFVKSTKVVSRIFMAIWLFMCMLIAHMKYIAKQRGERDVFYVHHGSVSASLRQEAEHALRDHLSK